MVLVWYGGVADVAVGGGGVGSDSVYSSDVGGGVGVVVVCVDVI